MAGYLFNLDTVESLEMYIKNGIYSTKLSDPDGLWKRHHEATFADYATMKSGDNIYFFIDRKIYGVGELVDVNGECKFCNFPEASQPSSVNYSEVKDNLLWDEGEYSNNQRWLCLFKPSPFFFKDGIDMDDMLASNPRSFKMLRAFWKVSFIKFDEDENQAFKDIILKFNQKSLGKSVSDSNVFRSNHSQVHKFIEQKTSKNQYFLNVSPILSSCAAGDRIQHEMAIEAGILYQLAEKDAHTQDIFGRWDYLSHQVIASPFKPIDYMDKMDVFGYSYIVGFSPTKSKYLVVEIKKNDGTKEDIEQLLKYVDWVKDEYCFGDYSMINAFLVGYTFGQEVIQHSKSVSVRKYTVGRRPARSLEWKNLLLVEYRFNSQLKKLSFRSIH